MAAAESFTASHESTRRKVHSVEMHSAPPYYVVACINIGNGVVGSATV